MTKLLKIDSSQKIVAKYKISQILICIFWQNILRLLQNKTSLWEIFSPKLKIQFDTAQGKSAENYNNILWNIFCETFNWKIVMYQCWIEINFFNLLSYKKVQTVLYAVTLKTIQDFLIKLDIKPLMHLLKISISLNLG